MNPLLLSIALARTTEPTEAPSLLVDIWTSEDGLPVDQVTDVVVDEAGFVWATTFDGLVRFDGHSMRVYRRAEFPELPSNRLVELELGPDGLIWMLAESGELVRFDGTDFSAWSWPGPPPDLLAPALDSLWAAGAQGVIRIRGGEPQLIPAPERTQTLAEVDGTLWVSGRFYGAWRLEGDELVEVPAAANIERARAMVQGTEGEVWLGGLDGLWRLRGDEAEQLYVDETAEICELLVVQGQLHVHDTMGWWSLSDPPTPGQRGGRERCGGRSSADWRLHRNELWGEELILSRQLGRLDTAAEAPDGSLWVASEGSGLLRVKARRVHTDTTLGGHVPWTVHADAEGGVWAGSYDGVIWRPGPQGLLAVRRDEESLIPSFVNGADGRTWIPIQGGYCAWSEEGCEPVAHGGRERGDYRAAHLDQAGRAWLGDDQYLWVHGADGSVSEQLDGRGDSIAEVSCFAEGPEALWAGSLGGGVLRIGQDGVRRWTQQEGLSSDHIRALWLDGEGGLWVGTQDAGLCYLPEEGEPTCLDKRHGLFDDAIHSLHVEQGRMWMSTNRGLSFVSVGMLEAFVRGEVVDVQALSLGERDGMLHREANGGASPSVARDAQGRLWYPTQRGLAVLDPSSIPSPDAPQPSLETLRVAGQARPLSHRIELGEDERALELGWTAPEFDHPEELRFRYRFEGEEWTLTRERSARWTNLPPGEHVFELQAGLGGVWSEHTQRLEVHRAPGFYESFWFPLSAALGGLTLGGLIFAVRARARRQRERELEDQVSQRTRELASANSVLEQQSARLAEVDRLRKRLIADLSHELRTPLTLVAGPLEDLREAEGRLDEPDRERLRVVRRNSRRLEELVEQLLDVARLEAGTIRLRARRCELGRLTRRVSERFSASCEQQGLELEVRTPEPAELWCDPDLIDKVLSNLLSNARKFTPAGGRITVLAQAPEDEDLPLRVSVQDTGIGVREDQLAQLFDRFVQGEQGDARRFEGVGIGLALARDLVELHGGEIGVDSVQDQGSTFWFTLPRGTDHLAPEDIDLEASLDEELPPAASEASPSASPTGVSREDQALVLVVEDHPDMRAFLMSHLGRHFEVQGAADGHEALRLLQQRRPAALVSDVMMPGMDGLELCRRLRSMPEFAELPVLLASAKAAEEDRMAGLELADDYMSKPLRMREMVQRVRKLVARSPEAPEPEDALPEVDRQLRDKLQSLIDQRMADPRFGVEQMAKAMAYSRRQLLREVKRVMGESPSDLLRARRMEAGRELLRKGSVHTVAEAAAQVGLSPAYFSRTYSAWFGTSPSEELKKAR